MTNPTIDELNRNIYLGKTATTERPYAADPVRRYANPDDLARHQRLWDQARARADQNAKLHAARIAKVDTDREAEATRRQVAARADLEATVKQRFLSKAGATVNDWERLKGQLTDQELLETPNPIEVEKAKMRRTGAYNLF